jgi:hypothetical protein
MQLRFVASESAFDYFRATRSYLETHGKPIALYSDKHSIFRVNSKDAVGGEGLTQFGRALSALNIDIICANSPQAKGRVERAFATLQDRLVKELRLAGISTMAAANAWLPGRRPQGLRCAHRPPPASALDPVALTQRWLVMPFRAGRVRRQGCHSYFAQSDISNGENL